jgi:hypothetical protein
MVSLGMLASVPARAWQPPAPARVVFFQKIAAATSRNHLRNRDCSKTAQKLGKNCGKTATVTFGFSVQLLRSAAPPLGPSNLRLLGLRQG